MNRLTVGGLAGVGGVPGNTTRNPYKGATLRHIPSTKVTIIVTPDHEKQARPCKKGMD